MTLRHGLMLVYNASATVKKGHKMYYTSKFLVRLYRRQCVLPTFVLEDGLHVRTANGSCSQYESGQSYSG